MPFPFSVQLLCRPRSSLHSLSGCWQGADSQQIQMQERWERLVRVSNQGYSKSVRSEVGPRCAVDVECVGGSSREI